MRRLLALLAFSAAAAFSQTPTITSVVNAESFGPQLCPGLIAVIFGSNFGTNAASASVSVGGKAAYVMSPVTSGQMNIELPFEAAVGPTTLTVTIAGVSSAAFPITLNAVSPYFVTQSGLGSGLAAATDASILVTAAAPAHAGDTVVAYAVGLGPTSPATPTGPAAITASLPAPLPTVTIGGVSASVTFAGIPSTYAGLYQLNITVPSGVSGTVPMVITEGGVSSSSIAVNSAIVTIAIAGTTAVPTITGVQNGASYGTQLSPGVLAIVYGSGFGTTLANVTLSVGGKPGYVVTDTENQLLVQLPFEAATGATSMTVSVSGTASATFPITLSATSPAFNVQNSAISGPAQVLETSTNAVVTATAPAHDGDTLYAYAVGLGPTNPPSSTGVQTVANPTATAPTVTVGGVAATGVSAVLTKAFIGIYQVNFTVPANIQGTVPLVISIGGQSSSTTVTLATPGISYIENNASFGSVGTVSPGSIASVFANSLATSANVISGLFPSTTSGGVQLTFNGTPAPLFHVIGAPSGSNPQQIDLLVPTNLPTSGTVNLQLTTSSAFYGNFPVTMVPSNPAFYRIPDPKVTTRVNVIAQFANTAWLALPVATTAALGLPSCGSATNVLTECGRPATIGDTLVLYATGLGLATPGGDPNGKPLPNGSVPPVDGSVLYKTPTTPVVTIGGQNATILFSGLAPGFPGEYQVDVTVPGGIASGDDVPISISILGATDATTTISIQPRPAG